MLDWKRSKQGPIETDKKEGLFGMAPKHLQMAKVVIGGYAIMVSS